MGKVIAITLVASLAVVIALPNEAQASHCGSDTWADGDAWSDNYWVGYNTAGTKTCDLNGNYTTGVQRINWYPATVRAASTAITVRTPIKMYVRSKRLSRCLLTGLWGPTHGQRTETS